MPRQASLALASFVLLLAAAPADDAGLQALRQQDLRVATIAYRLAMANVTLCPDRSPLSGLIVHDSRQYDPALRPAAIRFFGLAEGPGVLAVVPGSPAADAGLRADDRIGAVNGKPFTNTPADARAPATYDGVAAANTILARAYAAGPVRLTIQRGDKSLAITLRPAEGCASTVQLVPSARLNASADGQIVTITTAIADYAADDDQLAVVVAHEMAHNVLRHGARLDAAGVSRGILRGFGKNRGAIRATEEEADRVGLYLLARAGYDVAAAPAFWTRFGKQHGLGIFADGTHPGERTRTRILQETIAEITAQRARGEQPTPPAAR